MDDYPSYRLIEEYPIVDETTNWNKRVCKHCLIDEEEHEIVEYVDGVTDNRSCWGPGISTVVHRCSNCQRWNGPWVSTKYVGDGW